MAQGCFDHQVRSRAGCGVHLLVSFDESKVVVHAWREDTRDLRHDVKREFALPRLDRRLSHIHHLRRRAFDGEAHAADPASAIKCPVLTKMMQPSRLKGWC